MAGLFRVIYRCACVNMTYQYIKLKRRRLRQRFVKRLQKKAQTMKEWAKRNHSIVSSVLHTGSPRRSSVETESVTSVSRLPKLFSRRFSRRHSDSVVCSLNKESTPEVGRKHSLCVKEVRSASSHMTHHVIVHDLTVIPENKTIEIKSESDDKLADHRSNDDKKCPSGDSSTVSTLSLHDFDDDERILKTRLKATRDLVPISMCLLLVTGYIILGAMIFTSWEESWNYLVSFYFCFITLTTIGFGDFVPGMGRINDDERTVFCTIYLFFGMALLAMSFHLIQEEVKHKFRKLAQRIGLIEGKLTKMLDNYTVDPDETT